MQTKHRILYDDARDLSKIESESINLVVTSPPYPMISMWDEVFSGMNPDIQSYLDSGDGFSAHKLMHLELNKTWREISRVIRPGGLVCINIGDATRTVGDDFRLYANNVNILSCFNELGFHTLPEILWRKPSNSPTKFMGSGMLPGGAYVTLEHERILIFRKPTPRVYSDEEERITRRKSSYFWEERNKWFSDLWDLTGAKQSLNSKNIRKRSGAFPLEVPLRLIRMYSLVGDTVLDPFLGTGTTTLAAIISCRNSRGVEFVSDFKKLHQEEIPSPYFIDSANFLIHKRIEDHQDEMKKLLRDNKGPKYKSKQYGFPVVTRQEVDIQFNEIMSIKKVNKRNTYIVDYKPLQLKGRNPLNEIRSPKISMRVPRNIYK
jgi:DNA modification methylase